MEEWKRGQRSGKDLHSSWPAGITKNGCKKTSNDWLSIFISFFISLFRSPFACTAVVANPPGVHVQGAQKSVKSKSPVQCGLNLSENGLKIVGVAIFCIQVQSVYHSGQSFMGGQWDTCRAPAPIIVHLQYQPHIQMWNAYLNLSLAGLFFPPLKFQIILPSKPGHLI